jgi:hypothetical protein
MILNLLTWSAPVSIFRTVREAVGERTWTQVRDNSWLPSMTASSPVAPRGELRTETRISSKGPRHVYAEMRREPPRLGTATTPSATTPTPWPLRTNRKHAKEDGAEALHHAATRLGTERRALGSSSTPQTPGEREEAVAWEGEEGAGPMGGGGQRRHGGSREMRPLASIDVSRGHRFDYLRFDQI